MNRLNRMWPLTILLAALTISCRMNPPSPSPSQTAAAGTAAAQTAGTATQAPDPGALSLPSQLQGSERILTVYVVDEEESRDMDAEDYLCGVLAGEMRNDWPEEALKAQAIIARTYLIDFLNTKGQSQYGGADISTDEKESQAYDLKGVNDAIRQAVEETRGQVIVHGEQAIKAWFHACSGGKTATATEGLNYKESDPPYITVVESDESAAPPEALEWSKSFTKDEIRSALSKMGLKADSLEPVEISERGPSGRCVTLTFGETEVNAAELRKHLDPQRFRSTLLTGCAWKDGKLTVSGKGYGHGVGMSQWGAFTMAQNGSSCEEIIAHFFKDVKIVQAWK
ncbi:MAG: SpoIID/LytB domain-containing protein [Clostridiales bacterium]|nr:SpoIID/LytB domain-containing protein [Clostridiales bacterium]